jgi:hypothetical protein
MTLTVVVGSSGSGKTTFLNDGTYSFVRSLDVHFRGSTDSQHRLGHYHYSCQAAQVHLHSTISWHSSIYYRFPDSPIRSNSITYVNTSCPTGYDVDSHMVATTAYWDIYEREKTASTIKAGGTMAGEFTGMSLNGCVLHLQIVSL